MTEGTSKGETRPSSLKRKISAEFDNAVELGARPSLPIARDTSRQPNAQASPLARLPHELLVQIIEPILTQDAPLLLLPKSRFVKAKKSSRGSAWQPLVCILLACRAMYFAGIEVFYGRNVLNFVEALHLRKLVETRLSYDQRWSVTTIRLNIAWQRGRNRHSPWRLLHECDSCTEWKDVIDELPKIRRIVMKSFSDFNEADLVTQLDMAAFETRMRSEIGHEQEHLLAFEWPSAGGLDTQEQSR